MNQDDPFASPDLDKTIMIPSPGGRIPPTTQSSNPWQSSPHSSLGKFTNIEEPAGITGLNPLITAANPLLNSVTQLRMTLQHPNPSGLRDSLIQRIKTFETNAKVDGISPEKVVAARYALCTLLDETIASTPWGSGEWGKHSLLVIFHNEAFGGEKFFKLLTKLTENLKANRDLLELMYICLTLGFEGRFRVMENGKAQLDALRERLAQMLGKERNSYERDLSPQWHTTPFKPTKIFLLLPLWIFSALCGLVLLITYMSFNFLLNNASDPVFAQIQSIQAKNSTPKHIPVTQSPNDHWLTEFLAKEIQEGLVIVRNENDRSIITLVGDGIFSPGSTTISQRFVDILTRIAEALGTRTGQVQIIGHTDNQPIRSARFPSNWHLSQERAHSVVQLFIQLGLPTNRLSAEGRADAAPIALNSTPDGRARNRRVEIVVLNSHKTH